MLKIHVALKCLIFHLWLSGRAPNVPIKNNKNTNEQVKTRKTMHIEPQKRNCYKNDAQNIVSISFSTKLKKKSFQILGITVLGIKCWTKSLYFQLCFQSFSKTEWGYPPQMPLHHVKRNKHNVICIFQQVSFSQE